MAARCLRMGSGLQRLRSAPLGATCTQRFSLSRRRDLHSVLPILTSVAADSSAIAAATAPLVGPAVTQFLQISPPLAGQVMFASPMQAMRQFKQDGTTGAVSIIPYAAMAANGCAWTTYGALGADLTIMLPNASGCLFGALYCQQFNKYRDPEAVVLPHVGCAASLYTRIPILYHVYCLF